MPKLTLTPTRLFAGIWEGVLTVTGADEGYKPEIAVTHLGNPVEGVSLAKGRAKDDWQVQVPVPPAALTDGVQSFLISDVPTGVTLASFTIIAGEVLSDDIRAEVDLLRAELDMLKKAFRRHCNETKK